RDGHGGEREREERDLTQSRGEHVVTPNREADDPDQDSGKNDDRVSEKRFAGENRNDFRNDSHRGENQDVNFGVTEDPEKVLPENRLSAEDRFEEVGSGQAVHHERRESDGDRRESEDDEELGDQGHPNEHR